MSRRAEQMADDAAGRALARSAAAYKAAGQALPSRAELAAAVLPVCEALLPVCDGTDELSRMLRKSAKELRRQSRVLAAIEQQGAATAPWGGNRR